MQEMQVLPLGQEDQLEKEMANHSSILVWESQGQRILAGYSLWGCRRTGHNLVTKQQQALILQILTYIIKVWCFPYKWFGFFAWTPRQVCVFIFFPLLAFLLCVVCGARQRMKESSFYSLCLTMWQIPQEFVKLQVSQEEFLCMKVLLLLNTSEYV